MRLEQIMKKSFIVNIALVIIKLISGFIFNSVSLIADGIHSISDLLSDVFVILGIRHSVKPADEDHPFGHGKFEYVLSLLLGLSIILIAYNLGKGVLDNFNTITSIPSSITLLVVLFVVAVKLVLARYLIRKGDEVDSEIIRASGKESLSDVISSGVVFIGVVSVLVGNHYDIKWLLYGDKVTSIIIALFIIRIGIVIMYDAIQSLQGKSVRKEICSEYRQTILDTKGVLDVDQLEMIQYGPYYQAIIEIRVRGDMTVKEGHDIAHEVEERLLSNEKICHVSIHVNPEV